MGDIAWDEISVLSTARFCTHARYDGLERDELAVARRHGSWIRTRDSIFVLAGQLGVLNFVLCCVVNLDDLAARLSVRRLPLHRSVLLGRESR